MGSVRTPLRRLNSFRHYVVAGITPSVAFGDSVSYSYLYSVSFVIVVLLH